MTNPHSQAEPNSSTPTEAAVPGSPSGRSPRKGPRRATSPAGAPAKSATPAPALLFIGADGMIVPGPVVEVKDVGSDTGTGTDPETNDAGHSPAASSPPPAAVEVGADDASAEEALIEDSLVSAEGNEVQGNEAAIVSEAGVEKSDDESTPEESPSDVPDVEPTEASEESGESEESKDSPAPDSTPVEPDTQDSDDDAPAKSMESAGDIEPSDVPEIDSADASDASAESEESEESETSESSEAVGEPDGSEESAPLSRRERRLAEQKSDAEPTTPAPATETAPAPAATDVSEAASPKLVTSDARPVAKKRNRLLGFLKASLFMVVIAAIVVGMGTVLSGKDDAALGQSQTELNRQAAWDKTNSLMGQASTLASSAPTPKVAEILNQTATFLTDQSAALSDGLPPNTSTATTEATESPVSLNGFIVALNSSGDELLKSALSAEQAMGRVFAAAGTSQLVLAQSLSSAAGSTPPSSDYLPARVNFAAPEGPECKSALDPRPGTTIDSALRAAALGEQKAIYAYQVATTRLSEPQFSKSEALLARHEDKLKVLNEELRVRCLPLAAPVAGFTLDDQFTTAPATALSGLESELARIYADLAALSTAPSGETAGTAAPQAPADGKTPSNITELREISVMWLLDSTQSQVFWGGSVGALAGMPDA